MSKWQLASVAAAVGVLGASPMAQAADAQLHWQYSPGNWCPVVQAPAWNYGAKVLVTYMGAIRSGSYSGMPADAEILSFRYTGNSTAVFTRYSSKIFVLGSFSGAQRIGVYCRKAESFTVDDSGGVDATASFGMRLDSTAPQPANYTLRLAADGAVGLTPGTRTLTNSFLRDALNVPAGTNTDERFNSWDMGVKRKRSPGAAAQRGRGLF